MVSRLLELSGGQALFRREVRYFVSYAHDDESAARGLISRLERQLAPSLRYRHVLWGDWRIPVGERWQHEILNALRACDFGLLLISPAFLSSEFITRHELPVFVAGERPVISVELAPVDLERHDLKGLVEYQIFSWQSQHGAPRRSYVECATALQKERFAEDLFSQIEGRLDRRYV